MKRVLFVDDEQKVLDGLKRMLYPLRSEWNMTFASSGREALQLLSESDCDLIVTDVRMPEMTGIELLTEVIKRYPQVVRMVLSGTSEQETTLLSATLAHQYLAKPCDTATLRASMDRAFSLRAMLADPNLRQLISGIRSLPTLPSNYTRLVAALQESEVTPKQIGAIVSEDIAMSAKLLQLVNSAFFGVSRQISSPAEAAVYLGTDTIKALVLTVSVFSKFEDKGATLFSMQALRDHSLAVGILARKIAKLSSFPPASIDDSFTGGLLHDIGKLVLASNYPKEYDEVIRRSEARSAMNCVAEMEIFGATHAEVGAYLLWLWGLPDPVTEAAALHHRLPADMLKSMRPAVAVHLADAFIHHVPEAIHSECFNQEQLAYYMEILRRRPASGMSE